MKSLPISAIDHFVVGEKEYFFMAKRDNTQQEHEPPHTLIATPGRYTLKTVATLGECLHRSRKVRPTAVLYLYLGMHGWLSGLDAYDLVVKSWSIEPSWDAYIEDGQGPDPAGIYLFGADDSAYRGFDIEMDTTPSLRWICESSSNHEQIQ